MRSRATRVAKMRLRMPDSFLEGEAGMAGHVEPDGRLRIELLRRDQVESARAGGDGAVEMPPRSLVPDAAGAADRAMRVDVALEDQLARVDADRLEEQAVGRPDAQPAEAEAVVVAVVLAEDASLADEQRVHALADRPAVHGREELVALDAEEHRAQDRAQVEVGLVALDALDDERVAAEVPRPPRDHRRHARRTA